MLTSGDYLMGKPLPLVFIYCDSMTATAKIKNCYYNNMTRQICCKHIIVKELLSTGAIIVNHVRIDANLVDPLTKGLTREKVHNIYIKM